MCVCVCIVSCFVCNIVFVCALSMDLSLPVVRKYLLEEYEPNDHPPQSLTNLLQYFESTGVELSTHDTFIVFLYILMLETGFVPKEFFADIENGCNDYCFHRIDAMTKQFPSNWKGDRSYYISFVLPCLPDDICKFFCLVAGEDILATCTLQDIKIGFSYLFDPTIYVVDTNVGNKKFFQNLRGLSVKFKSEISYRLKTFMLTTNNVPHNNLYFLPIEVILHVLGYVNEKDLKNFAKTCRRFHGIDQDPVIQSGIARKKSVVRLRIARMIHQVSGIF